MRRLREKAMLEAEVTPTGDVRVEGQHVGQLIGFQFAADAEASGPEGKALRAAATNALAGEFERRAERLSAAADVSFVLASDGVIRWLGEPVARISEGDKVLAPLVRLAADDLLAGSAREKVQARLDLWLKTHVEKLLGPLFDLQKAEDLTGMARGIAYQLSEAVGVIDRAQVANDVRALDPPQRAALRKHGVRIGAYHLYLPGLMKPAPRTLAAQLWALKHGGDAALAVAELAHLAASGRTSVRAQAEIAKPLYRAAGFRVCGERAVRVDILERLADLVRPAIAYRPGETVGDPPPGAADDDGFVVVGPMTSLVGCSGEDFASILKSLGYSASKRAGPAITRPILKPARAEPVAAPVAADDSAATVAAAAAGAVDAPADGGGDAPGAVPIAVPTAEPAADAAPATVAAPADQVPAPVSCEGPIAAPAEATDIAVPVEAVPEGAEAVPATAEPAPIEIEVWRMLRQRRDRSERRTDRRGKPREARGERPPRGPRREDGAATVAASPPAEATPTVAMAAAGEAGPAAEPRPARPDRPAQREGERRPFREERRDRPPKSGKPGDRPGRPDRPERRDEDDRERPGRGGIGDRRREHPDSRPPRVFSTEERRDKGTADPDSPFAKLAALKARLEGKS
jgi:ATP-dependent RNA helicase SUPV3L1/SUV3